METGTLSLPAHLGRIIDANALRPVNAAHTGYDLHCTTNNRRWLASSELQGQPPGIDVEILLPCELTSIGSACYTCDVRYRPLLSPIALQLRPKLRHVKPCCGLVEYIRLSPTLTELLPEYVISLDCPDGLLVWKVCWGCYSTFPHLRSS